MAKLIRRETKDNNIKVQIDQPTQPVVAPDTPAVGKKTNLTVFPGGSKKKDDTQIDPEKMEALKRWRDEELKDYKVSMPDSTIKNPSYQKIAKALIDCDGFIMKAAISLRITYNKLNKFIKLNPKLKTIVQDTTEAFLDLTENKLRDAVLQGDKTAIIFMLRCKGRFRGWVDDQSSLPDTDQKSVVFSYNLRLPEGCKLVTNDGVTVFENDGKPVEEKKEVSNG